MAAQSVECKPSATDSTYQVIDLIGGPRRSYDDIRIRGDSIGSASPLRPEHVERIGQHKTSETEVIP